MAAALYPDVGLTCPATPIQLAPIQQGAQMSLRFNAPRRGAGANRAQGSRGGRGEGLAALAILAVVSVFSAAVAGARRSRRS